jgi:hypothetical protein
MLRPMILILDAVFPVVLPILVLIPLFLLLPVSTVTPRPVLLIILTMEPAPVSLDSILIPLRPSSAMLAQLCTARSAIPPIPLNAPLVLLVPFSTMPLSPVLALLDILSTEPPVSNVPITVNLATVPLVAAHHALMPLAGTSLKIVNASLDSMIQDQSTAPLAHPPV